VHQKFVISTSPDGLKAFIFVPSNISQFPSFGDLEDLIQKAGVTFGINKKVLFDLSSGKIKESGRIEIATGIAPVAGKPGYMEHIVDMTNIGKPKNLTNGRVDHHDLGAIVNVIKGTPLGRRMPAKQGINGMNVFGQAIPVSPVGELQLISKNGAEISSSDPDLLLASIDGAVTYNPKEGFVVVDQKVIEKDIDYSVGNINFTGNLLIKGSIRSGFTVETLGNIHVLGSVEDAIVHCGGDIEIEGGAIGSGTGVIESKGSVRVRHVENFTIKSGADIIVEEDSLHSTFTCDGKIKAKSLIGGNYDALGIICNNAGSAAEPKTVLDIAKYRKLIQERTDLQKKMIKNTEIAQMLKLRMFELVRSGMNSEGVLESKDDAVVSDLRAKVIECKKSNDSMNKRIVLINEIECNYKTSTGVFAQSVFPNTLIRFGNGERLIMEIVNNLKFIPKSADYC
jgi:uncharacterized protein (DUF342 family)